MDQIELMTTNVKDLIETIEGIGESITTPLIPTPDVESLFLTKEEIMVKILMAGGDFTGSMVDSGVGMDEETAYEAVYGELQPSGATAGNLLYPGVVNKDKTKVKENHPLNTKIEETKQDVKIAVKQIGIKTGEIKDASVQLGIEVGSAAVTIGASATIMPPGSGVPVAFSAVQSIFSSLQSFQTKVEQILPFLGPLTSLAILIPATAVDSTLAPINVALTTMKSSLGAVESVIGVIGSLKNSLSPPPGVGESPAEEIELEVSASQPTISIGESTKLDVKSTKGTWDYSYSWVSDNDESFYSTVKSPTVEPHLTTTYTVTVTDSNGASKSSNIIIIVI